MEATVAGSVRQWLLEFASNYLDERRAERIQDVCLQEVILDVADDVLRDAHASHLTTDLMEEALGTMSREVVQDLDEYRQELRDDTLTKQVAEIVQRRLVHVACLGHLVDVLADPLHNLVHRSMALRTTAALVHRLTDALRDATYHREVVGLHRDPLFADAFHRLASASCRSAILTDLPSALQKDSLRRQHVEDLAYGRCGTTTVLSSSSS